MIEIYNKHCDANKLQGGLLVAEMSSKNNLIDEKYTTKTIDIANKYRNSICGFISQSKISANDYLYMTPGVSITDKSDKNDQQYMSPYDVIYKKKSDIIIVGRSIINSDDILEETLKYKNMGWNSYLSRIN